MKNRNKSFKKDVSKTLAKLRKLSDEMEDLSEKYMNKDEIDRGHAFVEVADRLDDTLFNLENHEV